MIETYDVGARVALRSRATSCAISLVTSCDQPSVLLRANIRTRLSYWPANMFLMTNSRSTPFLMVHSRLRYLANTQYAGLSGCIFELRPAYCGLRHCDSTLG